MEGRREKRKGGMGRYTVKIRRGGERWKDEKELEGRMDRKGREGWESAREK